MKRLIIILQALLVSLAGLAQSTVDTNSYTKGYSSPGMMGLVVLIIIIVGGVVILTLMKKREN